MLPNEKIEVQGVALDVLTRGQGRPLLFLHGEDGLLWSEPVIDALAKEFRVVAPHHPAWGASVRPQHIRDVADMASLYCDYLEAQNEPFLVVGCSIGGWIAAEIAIRCRVPIAGLALVAPIGVKLGDRETRDFVDIYMASADELLESLYSSSSDAPDLAQLTDAQYVDLARAHEATARYGWQPYMHDPKLKSWLHRVNTPSVVIAGEDDRFALVDGYYRGYAELIGASGAELQTIPQAGHRVEEERPLEVAEMIVAFSQRPASQLAAAASEGN